MAAAETHRLHDREGEKCHRIPLSCRAASAHSDADSIPWPLVIGGIFLLMLLCPGRPAARVWRTAAAAVFCRA